MRDLDVSRSATQRLGVAAPLTISRNPSAWLTEMVDLPVSIHRHVLQADGRIVLTRRTGLLGANLDDDDGDGMGGPGPVHPADRSVWLSALRRSAERMKPFGCDLRCRARDGDWIWIRACGSPRRLDDGSIGWVGIALDITDLKRTESAAHEREEQLRAFAESASDWFWQTDASHGFTMLTHRFFSASGLAPESVFGRAGWEICVDHPLAGDWSAHRRVLEARQPFRDFHVVLQAEGATARIARVSGVPFCDEAGQFSGYRGAGRDVTEQVELETRLRQQQALLDSVLAHIPVVLFALDAELRFTLCTGYGLADIGHKPSVAVGKHVDEAYPEQPRIGAAARRALAGHDAHIEMEAADRVVWADMTPVRDGAGRVVAVVGVARDMTRESAQARAIEASEARFRSLVTNLRNIVFCHGVGGDGPHGYDAQGVIVYGLDAADITGAVAENGRSSLDEWYDSIHPDDRDVYIEAERRRKELGEPYTLEFRIRHPATGEERWLRETAWSVPSSTAGRVYLDSYIIDLTERRRIEAAVQESEARYRRLIENTPIPILQHSDWRCTLVNPAMVDLLGVAGPEQLIGADPTSIVAPESRDLAIERTRRLYAEGGNLPPLEYRLFRRDGDERIVEARTGAFRQNGSWVVQVALTDITERKRVETAMRHLAQHDVLTGLPNRALLLDRLGQAVAQARRGRHGVGVMLMDLDGFKAVNDRLGHAAGDTLLRQVAGRIEGMLRAADTFARLGGDEFAILQTQLRSASGAATLAGKIVEAMTVPFVLDGQEVRVGVSIGIALSDEGKDPELLLRRADLALYRAKTAGRGRFAFYESGMNAVVELNRRLEAELRAAVAAGAFRMLYQPQVSLPDGGCIGFEALVRWPRPDGVMLAAENFVPAAESSGLIRPLGQWVLREVACQTARWRACGQDLPIAVNVSVSQLRSGRFVEDLLAMLAVLDLPGAALRVELAEAVIAEPTQPGVAEGLDCLRAVGVGILIDEFGRGPLALQALAALPVDGVKLDRGLTALIGQGPRAEATLTATIAAARGLGLRITATGVETAAQAAFLAARGCDAAQGYLFGPPLPAEALAPGPTRTDS